MLTWISDPSLEYVTAINLEIFRTYFLHCVRLGFAEVYIWPSAAIVHTVLGLNSRGYAEIGRSGCATSRKANAILNLSPHHLLLGRLTLPYCQCLCVVYRAPRASGPSSVGGSQQDKYNQSGYAVYPSMRNFGIDDLHPTIPGLYQIFAASEEDWARPVR